ncbi:MAG: hypothetical protein JXB39_00140, partial [Deltaproteobacteria bacterium]|nr:hypothetical protein [Deltaproteobacteria bacterium]
MFRTLFTLGTVVGAMLFPAVVAAQDSGDTGAGVLGFECSLPEDRWTPTPAVNDGYVRDPYTGEVEEAYTYGSVTYMIDSITGLYAGNMYLAED